MKTILIVLALLLHCGVCHAQNPNPKKNDGLCADDACLHLKFPYMFCDQSGKPVVKCSDNPNNEPGLKFMKVKLPIEFNYLDWTLQPEVTGGDGIIHFYQGWDTNFTGYPVFVRANMPRIVEAAARRWSTTDLCPPQGPDAEYVDCQITVRWSFNDEDFEIGRVVETPAATRRVFDPRNCMVHCPSSFIVLNQQPNFLRPDAYGRPTHFFGTERNNYGYIPPPPTYIYTDAYTALVHEFGHLLGFAHTNEAPCGDPNSIMKPAWQSRETGDLTWADNCMFLKAYCCEKTKTIVWYDDPNAPPPGPPINNTKPLLEGAHTDFSFTVAPNPVRAGTIKLSLHGRAGQERGVLRVVDGSGSAVLEQSVQAVGARDVSLDVSALPSGFYLLQLVQEGRTYSRKFMIAE